MFNQLEPKNISTEFLQEIIDSQIFIRKGKPFDKKIYMQGVHCDMFGQKN